MTARLGSLLLKVESGAEKVVARALRRFRANEPASEATQAAVAEVEPVAAEPAGAEPAGGGGAEAGPAEAEFATARPVAAPEPAPAPHRVAPSRPAVPASSPPVASAASAGGQRAHLREPELPPSYGRSRVVVLAIDPHHVHAYWEVTPGDAEAARARLAGTELAPATWVLRFHDVTGVAADTASAHAHFDVDIDLEARNWYIDLWAPDKTYLVELGARVSGEFIAVCRAAPVAVPAAQLSPPRQPEWRTADLERATTHAVPPSDPRVPRLTRSMADAPETARSLTFGAAPYFGDEQPWVAATRGSDSEGAESAPAEAPPTSKAPATPPATPHALALDPHNQPGAPARRPGAPGERSRSVSLPGVASGSGGSFSRGGDSSA